MLQPMSERRVSGSAALRSCERAYLEHCGELRWSRRRDRGWQQASTTAAGAWLHRSRGTSGAAFQVSFDRDGMRLRELGRGWRDLEPSAPERGHIDAR